MPVYRFPLTTGSVIARAYKPLTAGDPEERLAGLKRRSIISSGLRIPRRAPSGKLSGQIVLYSTLNRDAAVLARHGKTEEAVRVAQRAAVLEAGAAFTALLDWFGKRASDALPELQSGDQILRDTIENMGRLLSVGGLASQLLQSVAETEEARRDFPVIDEVGETYGAQVTGLTKGLATLRRADFGEEFEMSIADLEPMGLATLDAPVVIEVERGLGETHLAPLPGVTYPSTYEVRYEKHLDPEEEAAFARVAKGNRQLGPLPTLRFRRSA